MICNPRINVDTSFPRIVVPIRTPPDAYPRKPTASCVPVVENELIICAIAKREKCFVRVFQRFKARKVPLTHIIGGINQIKGPSCGAFRNSTMGCCSTMKMGIAAMETQTAITMHNPNILAASSSDFGRTIADSYERHARILTMPVMDVKRAARPNASGP